MLRRKVVALSLVLLFCLGTGTALAAAAEPSELLLRMAARANETIDRLVESTQQAADRVVDAHNSGRMSYAMADATLQVLCTTLRVSTDAVIAPVIAQARREGISWDCVYEEVPVGWRTVLIDPILVPGNSD